MSQLYDCLLINNELDLLELRLKLTSHLVDYFVVVEATRTFSGQDKPLHFAANRARFEPWSNQIRHIAVQDMPSTGRYRWPAEVHQRNQLLRGLEDAEPSDIIVISDVDEICFPSVLATLRNSVDCLTGLEMISTFHRANWHVPLNNYSLAARAIPRSQLVDPHRQRNVCSPERVIREAGLHLTYLGDVESVQRKFEAYSHDEMDNQRGKSPHHIRRAQTLGVDLFTNQLVRVLPPALLSSVHLELLAIRPDLFDFREFPAFYERFVFRWYAKWRSAQPADSTQVATLDRDFDYRPREVMSRAASAILYDVVVARPRHIANRVRQRLRDHRLVTKGSAKAVAPSTGLNEDPLSSPYLTESTIPE